MQELTDRQKARALVAAGECDDMQEAYTYLLDAGMLDDDGTMDRYAELWLPWSCAGARTARRSS